MGRTVTRLRNEQTGVDRYNNPVYSTVEADIPGALFDPGSSGETVTVGRAVLTSTPTLYWLREWPDLVAGDRVRVDGVEYDVEGRPAAWTDDLSGTDLGGLVVTLRAVSG